MGRQLQTRLQYLDWLRGVAVTAMVLAHVIDSWTRAIDRTSDAFYTLRFVGGVASPLFLFLAGVAMALSASSKGRREGSHATGAALARRRGWEIFALGLVFRVQAQVLGLGPVGNLLKVDMLNIMGLAMVAAASVWQGAEQRRRRLLAFTLITGLIAMVTPIVRQVGWLSPLPDPLEAYLRPAGPYSAFPLFPWAGFLFAGVIIGDLVDAVRGDSSRQPALHTWFSVAGGASVLLGWWASFQPSIYESARFWNDSPTFFFIRLGLVVLLVPIAWVLERITPVQAFRPLSIMGRSSLFVYWIHVEMVYGVAPEPLKNALPLWGSVLGAAVLSLALYAIVLLKNRVLERYELRGPFRLLAPVIR